MLPMMSSQLAERIEQNDIDYTVSRLSGMQRAQENPLGIEIQQFGHATAFLIQGWPDFWYGNRVLGLEPADQDKLGQIAAFFSRHRLDFRFEIMPGKLNSSLGSRLHDLGFCQMGFNTALYGQPAVAGGVALSTRQDIRQIRPEEIDLFLDIYQAGFGLPSLAREERRAVRSWLQKARDELYLCLASIHKAPIGVGVLYVKNGVGLLADATTLPEFRGQGCHAALIRHRIAQAAKMGGDLLTSFVEFGSASHHNLERAGLRVAYTKAMWWKAETPGLV